MSTAVAPAPTSVSLPVGRLAGVGAVVFCANAALLVLQLVAGRLLAPFVGSSLETWTAIIGVFLTGIALGNAYGGRLADRYPTPRTLAILLGTGAVAALWMLAFPLLMNSTGAYKSIPLGPRIPVLAVALCLPAGFVLSLLTPLAIKLGLPDVAHTGRVAGLIFALSTLGCLIGNYLTGFYLIPSFTINTLVVVAAGVLVLLALVSLLMGNAGGATRQAADGEGVGTPSINPHAFPDTRQAYLIVFLASFCGMTLELTASRVLAQNLGTSLFTWTGVIGVMLAGTALGNFTGGLIADWASRPAAKLGPRVVLAGTLISAGAATVLIFVWMALVTRLNWFATWEPITQVMGWTLSLFFLPMLLLGLVSPQVIRLAVPDLSHAGRVAGRVYAWSTVGAIAGTFAAGYFLLSTLGTRGATLGAALVVTLTSLLVVNIWSDARAAARADGPAAAYNAAGAGALLYLFSIVLGGVTGGFILTGRGEPDHVAQVESNYYTIKVSRVPDREAALGLYLDRLLHSVVDPYDPTFLYYKHEYIQMELFWVAQARSPEPRSLVVGGGGYTFPRLALELMPESTIDVVEIDPKVTEVARDYLGLKEYPNLHVHHMDGRQFVAEKAQPGCYDLIIQDAVNDFSVPAHLMTKEYNDAVKAALKPGGAYLLTIIDSVAHGKLWKAAVATLAETYPDENIILLTPEPVPEAGTAHGNAWDSGRQVMVIYASDAPFSPEALERAFPDRAAGRRAALQVGPADLPGCGPAAAARVGVAAWYALPRTPEIYTTAIPRARVQPFIDREPGVVLTDQFCPIDNLMADVFRRRMKE